MPQKKHKPEEIVAKLRQVDVLFVPGRPVAELNRSAGYCRPATEMIVGRKYEKPSASASRQCRNVGNWRNANVPHASEGVWDRFIRCFRRPL